MRCTLGLDIGTTSTIGILIQPDEGKVLALASRPVTLSSPRPGFAEEEPAEWWDNVRHLVPEVLRQAGVAADAVAAVGVTGMLPAVVLLDEAGAVLRPAIQQSDGRCGAEVAELLAELSEAEFTARTGNGINQQLVSAKLRWIEKHEPDVFSRIATVFGSYDYVNWMLTGVRAADRNWALEAGFIDLADGTVAADLVTLGHVPRGVVPGLSASHERLGAVSEAAAAATGLRAGTPVAGGSADHIASAYAAGIVAPGDVLLKLGGAADILIATDRPVADPRLYLDFHLVPGLFMPNGCMASGGSALNWFAGRFAGPEREAAERAGLSIHAYLDRLAAEVPAGADGVLAVPYFLGEKTPVHDPDARAILSGLSLNHGPAHVWRALLEGFGYAFRHHVEVFNAIGHTTSRFLASDGGSRSAVWMQAIADILQADIQLLDGHPGSCLGAAWMAAIAADLTDDWHGVGRFVSHGETVRPRRDHAALYDAGYRRFRQTYRRLADLGQDHGE